MHEKSSQEKNEEKNKLPTLSVFGFVLQLLSSLTGGMSEKIRFINSFPLIYFPFTINMSDRDCNYEIKASH